MGKYKQLVLNIFEIENNKIGFWGKYDRKGVSVPFLVNILYFAICLDFP